MPLFNVAVFIGLTRLDLLPADPVMSQESFIRSCELFGVTQVVYGRTHPVRSVFRRHTAQLPECILQSLAQALERLRVADAACLPVGIRQHKVINQMRESLAIDRHPQFPAVCKVRLAQLARSMLLRKEHFSRRPFRCPPVADPASQRPYLSVIEPARMCLLQLLEDRLCLQTWFYGE